MAIEVQGIWWRNSGSVLMLQAIRQALPGHRLAVQQRRGDARPTLQGVVRKLDRGDDPLACSLSGLIGPRARRRLDLATDEDIALVLDSSGFAYGDIWGPGKLHARLARRLDAWRRRNVALVLLPQAFGPFTDGGMVRDIRRVVGQAALVYARDQLSLEHLLAACGSSSNLRLAPDFTALVAPLPDPSDDRLGARPCYVPNAKMISTQPTASADAFIDRSAHLLQSLLRRGLRPFVLLHETSDRAVAQRLQARLGAGLEVVEITDPRRTKAILGAASMVVSARFHALVSALSQGTPAIAMGWTHKYQALLSDYGVPELYFDVVGDPERANELLGHVLDGTHASELRDVLRAAAARQRHEIESMWDEVGGLLPPRTSVTGRAHSPSRA